VEQIVAVLKQAELGVPVAELIRQVGITEQTLYRWKKQYKGLETDQVGQFQAAAGRERTAEAAGGGTEPGQDDVAGRAGKQTVTPRQRRPVVSYLHDTYRVSERRACRVTRIPVLDVSL
jgi:putative transposase